MRCAHNITRGPWPVTRSYHVNPSIYPFVCQPFVSPPLHHSSHPIPSHPIPSYLSHSIASRRVVARQVWMQERLGEVKTSALARAAQLKKECDGATIA